MKASLTVFVDSLGFDAVRKWDWVHDLDFLVPMKPIVGYSVNIKPVMFAGVFPDDAGEYCEWQFRPDAPAPPRIKQWTARMLDLSPFVRSVIDRGLTKLTGSGASRVPFQSRHLFVRGTRLHKMVYEKGFPYPSVCSNSAKAIYSDFPRSAERDRLVFERALQMVETAPDVFVASADLDGITHERGLGSPEYEAKCAELSRLIGNLYRRFAELYPEGRFALTSDHGMSPVTTPIDGVRLPIPVPGGVVHFTDSTLLRVWGPETALATLRLTLDDWTVGARLTDAERAEFGIRSRSFGDEIFVLHEGYVFAPSYVSRRPAKAMHGYSPSGRAQWGVVLSNVVLEPNADHLTPLGLYRSLSSVVRGA